MKTAKKRGLEKTLRQRELESKRGNVTFRLKTELLKRFKEECAQKKFSQIQVLELLIEDYIKGSP